MAKHTLVRLLVFTVCIITLGAITARGMTIEPSWDLPPRLVDEPAGFHALRARFEKMSIERLEKAGYQVAPVCIEGAMLGQPELGAMGQHAEHHTLYAQQFQSGKPNPHHPPVVLVAQGRVVGVEWEFKNVGQERPVLWGQPVNLGPAHPGVEEPHYMLHAYFRPDGKILFGDWDPALSCGGSTGTHDGVNH